MIRPKSILLPFTLVLQLCLLLLVLFVYGSVKAAEVGPRAPYPPNSTPTNATNGAHTFYIRAVPGQGVQRDVVLLMYYPANVSDAQWSSSYLELHPGIAAIQQNVCNLGQGDPGVPSGAPGNFNSQFMTITIRDATGRQAVYHISRAQVCSIKPGYNAQGQDANNTLYARYRLPGNTAPNSGVNTLIQKHQVTVTVELNPAIAPGSGYDAGGGRLQAIASLNSVQIGQQGGPAYTFPVIGNWGVSTLPRTAIRIPLGFCGPPNPATATRQVGLYDADQGLGDFSSNILNFRIRDLQTGGYLQLNGGTSINGSIGGPGNTVFTPNNFTNTEFSGVDVTFEVNKKYEFVLNDLHPRNTVDIKLPFDSIYGDPDSCFDPTNIIPQNSFVNVAPQAIGGSAIEVGDSTTFQQLSNVNGFPTDIHDWGWNEQGVRRAINTQTPPNQYNYPAQENGQDAGASAEVQILRLCAGGNYNLTCGNYQCQDGTTGNTCGNYNWQCEWTGGGGGARVKNVGWQPGAPSCNIFHYQCRDNNGNWQNQYRNFNNSENDPGCGNRFNCPAPSGEPNFYDTNYGPGVCKIFRCAYNPDPSGYFYAPGSDPDANCSLRCSNGAGLIPLLFVSEGDTNCYEQPVLQVRCVWASEPGLPATVFENVINNGTYCGTHPNTFITKQALTLGDLCVVTAAQAIGWIGTPPGKGRQNNPNLYRRNWIIDVNPPEDTACSKVGSKPYFHAYGGDVNAAASFGPACTPNPTTTIRAFNNDIYGNIAGQPFTGSGSQLAAFARGTIQGFISRSQSPGLPLALTFANTTGAWGGGWSGSFCIPNDEWLTPANVGSPVVGGGVINGKDWRYFGSQDVYIVGNSSYPVTFPLNNVPSLKIVTTGNVYISANVTDLSVIIMAKGKIYTCALDNGAGGLRTPTGAEMYQFCGNQLRVRGSFVADQVKLLRTPGTTRYAPTNPATGAGLGTAAELFFYTPETWIQSPDTTPNPPNSPIESMINLPPIL